MNRRPNFIITIDTEGDNLWSNKSKTATTKNASFLPRFQELCEKYKLKPTYLVNYEMANSVAFQKFGKDILRRKVGEIGMHLHAWDMPPSFKLTKNDFLYHPYLIEYPEEIMWQKIKLMTECLENIFGVKMLSHRAGRWGFNETYAKILIENGYKVDCSVTPHVSWKNSLGDPAQCGGTNYTKFPEDAYFIDTDNISRPGNSTLLEVPVSIKYINGIANKLASNSIICNSRYARKGLDYAFSKIWLRPNGKNLNQMIAYLKHAIITKKSCVEFILHSSELMPEGSPYFKSELSIEKLYNTLDILFHKASLNYTGCTLSEYYEIFKEQNN